MIHQARLYLLRRRNDIILFVGMTTMITTLILVFSALVLLHRQSNNNERILKGLSCILLILPENRTQAKVQSCIRVNNAGNTEFLFKTLEDPKKTAVTAIPAEDNKTLLLVPVKGDKGSKGDAGAQGPPGVGIKGDKGDSVTIKGQDGVNGAQGEPGASGREVEFQYNATDKRIEWRYVGDEGWQVLIDQCVLTDTCGAL